MLKENPILLAAEHGDDIRNHKALETPKGTITT